MSIQLLVSLIATQQANLVLEHDKLLEEVMYFLGLAHGAATDPDR